MLSTNHGFFHPKRILHSISYSKWRTTVKQTFLFFNMVPCFAYSCHIELAGAFIIKLNWSGKRNSLVKFLNFGRSGRLQTFTIKYSISCRQSVKALIRLRIIFSVDNLLRVLTTSTFCQCFVLLSLIWS